MKLRIPDSTSPRESFSVKTKCYRPTIYLFISYFKFQISIVSQPRNEAASAKGAQSTTANNKIPTITGRGGRLEIRRRGSENKLSHPDMQSH